MEDFGFKEDGSLARAESSVMDKGMECTTQEVVVVFTTALPDKFRLPDQSIIVPAHFQRLELSKQRDLRKTRLLCLLARVSRLHQRPFVVDVLLHMVDLQLINQLLQEKIDWGDYGESWQHQPFDFLVDGETLLRTSLQEYMTSHGLTAEVTLTLQYQLAVHRLREQHLPPCRDWIASLAPLPRRGLLVEASYDGRCRLHQIPPLAEADTSNGAADSTANPVTQLPMSAIVVDMSLNQGPLVAAAAFAGGAYLPSGCIQMILGSKAGGYNVVDVWEEQQSEQDVEFIKKESEGLEQCTASVTCGPGNNDMALADEAGPTRYGHEVREMRTTRRAALKAAGCQGSEITCLGVSHDGVTAASGGADGKVLLWDNVPEMMEAAIQQQHRKECEPSSARDNSGSSAPSKHIDSFPRKRKRVAQKHCEPLTSRPRAKEPKSTLCSHTDRVSDLCFPMSAVRCVLYTSALDETICAWDTIVGGQPLSVWTTTRPVTSVCCSPVNGTIICSAHVDGRVRLWDIRSGSVAASINDSAGSKRKASSESVDDQKSYSSVGTSAPLKCSGAVVNGNAGQEEKRKTAHLVLSANSRLDRRFTFGSVPDKRATTHVRWCPMKEREYWIATVSQDGMLRLRDLRSASMPLFSVEVCGKRANVQTGTEAEGSAYGKNSQESLKESSIKKGPPVRLLSCCWLDSHRIVTGGSDGIVRVFTIGPTMLVEHSANP